MWVQPPWSDLMPWAHKAVAEHEQGNATEILWWSHAATETAYARLLFSRAAAVCFWSKRVNHPLPGPVREALENECAARGVPAPGDNGSKWGNMLIYLGPSPIAFAKHFRQYGTVMIPDGISHE